MATGDNQNRRNTVDAGAFAGTLAVLESVESARKRSREVAKALGYRLAVESSPLAIERRLLGKDPPELVLVALPESATFVQEIQKATLPPIVIASMSGPPETARARFSSLDADLYSVRPHSVDSLGPILHAAGQLAQSRKLAQSMRMTEKRLRDQLREAGHSGQVTGFQHFDFFKKLLVLEIKRAKRFGYPIAVCVIAFDPSSDGNVDDEILDTLHRKVATAITTSMRDIDMPVDYAEGRMLLLLPYTDDKGASELARRILVQVRKTATVINATKTFRISVSIGVAASGVTVSGPGHDMTVSGPGHDVSFAKLMRDANAALKAAQLKGGNRLIAR